MMKNVKITTYEKDGYFNGPRRSQEFIEWWQEKINQIPEKFRKNAEITIDAELCYGDPELEIRIFYYRPETKLEESRRKSGESICRRRAKEKDLKLLKELKEKYPDET